MELFDFSLIDSSSRYIEKWRIHAAPEAKPKIHIHRESLKYIFYSRLENQTFEI